MNKNIRVYELARELDVKSKDVLRILQDEMNLEIQNHMSTINDNVARRVRQLLAKDANGEEAGGAAATAVEQAPEPAPAPAPAAAKSERPEKTKPSPTRTRARQRQREEEDSRDGRPAAGRTITLTGPITVSDLADKLGIRPAQAVQKLFNMGIMAAANQEVDADTAALIASEFGVEATVKEAEPGEGISDEDLLAEVPEGDPKHIQARPPVVTVLGHVDHGKTTLLDAIRKTKVAAGEAGGITQHIGASTVQWEGNRIVFLDTPGHEAFTQMRARGAQVTDIAVLVVAADDGIMPQTVEAINHAKAAGVPIIVAINKVDKPTANIDRVKQQLTDHGLIPEDWGGDTICVPVSALQGEGIDDLLEMIVLVAEISELKANPRRPAIGTVIESRIDKGRGPVATVLVQEGTLKRGDAFVAGATWGRVRAMLDDHGKNIKKAGPSTPVEVLGFQEAPEAGDRFIVLQNEKRAREVAEERHRIQRETELRSTRTVTLEDVYRRAQSGEFNELRVILKADVQGSLEAARESIMQLGTEEVGIQPIHAAVGAISENDVMLASASDAVILGFNVRPEGKAAKLAEAEQVEIRTYRVIYEMLDDVRKALEGLLEPEIEEVQLGRVEVRTTFRVPGVGTVAGCYVTEGVVRRDANVRLVRDGTIVYEGKIASLRRFKDDVREVREGFECGIALERFQDIKDGDILEIYTEREVQRTLDD